MYYLRLSTFGKAGTLGKHQAKVQYISSYLIKKTIIANIYYRNVKINFNLYVYFCSTAFLEMSTLAEKLRKKVQVCNTKCDVKSETMPNTCDDLQAACVSIKKDDGCNSK